MTRPYSHSLSDDERLYKTEAEREAEALRDPIVTYPRWLISEGILDEHAYKRICHEVDDEIQQITDRVLHVEGPAVSAAIEFLSPPISTPAGCALNLNPGSRANRTPWWTRST